MTISVGFGPVPYCQPRYMSATPAPATAPRDGVVQVSHDREKVGYEVQGKRAIRHAGDEKCQAEARRDLDSTVGVRDPSSIPRRDPGERERGRRLGSDGGGSNNARTTTHRIRKPNAGKCEEESHQRALLDGEARRRANGARERPGDDTHGGKGGARVRSADAPRGEETFDVGSASSSDDAFWFRCSRDRTTTTMNDPDAVPPISNVRRQGHERVAP